MKFLSELELVKRELEALEVNIRMRSGCWMSAEQNKKLQESWSKKLQILLINHFGTEEFK